MNWQIEREQATGLRTRSIFVVLEQDGQFRRFEAVNVPLEAEAQSYLTAHCTPAGMWAAGQPLPPAEVEQVQAHRQAGDLQAVKAFIQAFASKTEAERWQWVVRQILLLRQNRHQS
ncbi:MAG: hypothetical protein K8I82_30745 [Anaerolineae bacterium]|nr:hypothetical protein [Anaerolineae bacterium]